MVTIMTANTNNQPATLTLNRSVAGKQYNAEVEAGTTELSFNEYKVAYLAAQEAKAVEPTTEEVLAIVEGAIVATEVALEVVKVNKALIAKSIFEEELAKGELVRKDVLVRFLAEAGLSKAGANTYYQNFRKTNGLVHAKVEEVAEVLEEAVPA
jgi:hypothetical protein